MTTSDPHPCADTSHLQTLFAQQAATALRLRSSTAAERIAKIRRLRDAVLARTEAWYAAAQADFGKPAGEVDLGEILPVCMEANKAMRRLQRWMRPQRVRPTLLTLGTSAWVQAVPRGRCLIMAPWNYPLNLSLGPLVSALAAGNTVILKPSELSPRMAALIAEVVRDCFSADEVSVVEGDAQVARALLQLPFEHIFFTGSPAIGQQVMAAAATHLSSVTLELGGKNPAIIDASADLQLAARNVMWAKFANAGQTCISPDHVYVHASVKEAWLARCRAELESAFGPDVEAQRQSPFLSRIVNARHLQRLQGLLQQSLAQGSRVRIGGDVDAAQRFIAPTLIDSLGPEDRLLQEEIFGPLLPVIAYTDLDEVIERMQADTKPLALYVYSRDEASIQRLLQQTASGGVCVNHALLQFLHGHLPFGGVNHSGLGSAHGHYGFKAFSHERATVRTRLPLVARLLAAGEVSPAVRRLLRHSFKWL